MDVVQMRVPYEFIRDRTRMSWRDVLFGLEQGLLDPAVPVQLAAAQVATEEHSDPILIDLAGLSSAEDAGPYVKKLASNDREGTVEEIRDKWLCIVLGWIFEHREDYPDPLQAVEEVYADFDYPERIAGFVRYMPSNEPDLGSRELNEARLHAKWKRYLEDCARMYAPQVQANAGED